MELVRFYRPRNSKGTALWKLSEALYDRLRGKWEERFESKFGFWRGLADEAVARYWDCGLAEMGFARISCDGCRAERLLTFSCRTRQLCPSCGAKRGAIFGAFLREEVVEEVGHQQWVFTIPKIIRTYFLRNRELLGDLSRAAWETVLEMMTEAAGDLSLRPGMVIVPQSFGSSVNFHPHLHSIVSRGGWTPTGEWMPIPYVDAGAAARLFRHKVLKFLRAADLIDQERMELILGWGHNSGFSVHNSVVVHADDGEGLERLARYLARPPVSLERMEWDRTRGEVIYRTGRGHPEGRENRADGEERAGDFERLDGLEFLARVVTQLPEPRKHSIRYYGHYAAAARAKRRRVSGDGEGAGKTKSGAMNATEAVGLTGVAPLADKEPDTAERSALRKKWAQLIRRIYEIDPLLCPCGGTFKVVSIITEPKVINGILAHLAKAATGSATMGSGAGPPHPNHLGPAPEPIVN